MATSRPSEGCLRLRGGRNRPCRPFLGRSDRRFGLGGLVRLVGFVRLGGRCVQRVVHVDDPRPAHRPRGTLEPFADKWRAFGWSVIEVDGHDHRQHLRREPYRHGHGEEQRLHPVALGEAVDQEDPGLLALDLRALELKLAGGALVIAAVVLLFTGGITLLILLPALITLAVLGMMGLRDIHQMNGLKNWGGTCMNFVAAVLVAAASCKVLR